jgi:hypothetical protein
MAEKREIPIIRKAVKEDILMMDIVFVGLTIFFGIISWAFIVLCSKV